MSEAAVAEETPVEQEEVEPQFLIPFSLAQALVDYFSEKPYKEAAGFVNALVSLEKVE